MPTTFNGTILPSNSTPVKGTNATDITSVTPVSILAAVSGKAYYITKIIITQPTAAETTTITIREITTALTLGTFYVGAGETVIYDVGGEGLSPIPVTVSNGVEGLAAGSYGDTKVTIHGFIGTP